MRPIGMHKFVVTVIMVLDVVNTMTTRVVVKAEVFSKTLQTIMEY